MGHRLSRIVTRTGDNGTTGLANGTRVAKDDPRIEVLGDIDELNCVIGVLRAQPLPAEVQALLTRVQHDLFDLGGELSLPGHAIVGATHLARLEQALEHYNASLPALKEFILPGGGTMAAHCHLARAVCRRAERRAVSLHATTPLTAPCLAYLNRLSDLLFVLARVLTGPSQETQWQRD